MSYKGCYGMVLSGNIGIVLTNSIPICHKHYVLHCPYRSILDYAIGSMHTGCIHFCRDFRERIEDRQFKIEDEG